LNSPEPFDSAAELGAYYRLKWSIATKSTLLAVLVALALLAWNWYASLALAAGFACGLANALGIMRGSERLIETRNPLVFGLSSLLRLVGFSIVAAVLAARGPWWSLGPFLAGFFFPLAAYALGATRRKPSTDR
jgi:hypothetical protein